MNLVLSKFQRGQSVDLCNVRKLSQGLLWLVSCHQANGSIGHKEKHQEEADHQGDQVVDPEDGSPVP